MSQAPPGRSGLDKGLQDHTQPLIEVSILGSRGEPWLCSQGSALSEPRDALCTTKGRRRGKKRPPWQQTEYQLSHSTNGPPYPPEPANCTNSSLKVPVGQDEVPRPLGDGVYAFYCTLPAQPQSHGQQHPFREAPHLRATPAPPPSHLLGARVLGEPPNSKLPFPDPGSHSWTGRGVFCCPSLPGPPPYIPLESTS